MGYVAWYTCSGLQVWVILGGKVEDGLGVGGESCGVLIC